MYAIPCGAERKFGVKVAKSTENNLGAAAPQRGMKLGIYGGHDGAEATAVASYDEGNLMQLRPATLIGKEQQHLMHDLRSLNGLWERAALMRAFLWNQHYAEPKPLLVQFLVRLKRFFNIDFCAGGVIDGEVLSNAAVPEATLEQLPENFPRRCLDLVARARSPITWNEVKPEFGFRSMVVAPVAPPAGEAVGFLLLGHATRRFYSAAELFVLQNLAGELAWVARELHDQRQHRLRVANLSHDVANTLQSIVGYTGLIRQNLKGVPAEDQRNFFANIEADITRILHQLKPAEVDLIDDVDDQILFGAAAENPSLIGSGDMVSKKIVGEK